MNTSPVKFILLMLYCFSHVYAAENNKNSDYWQLGHIVSGSTGQPAASSTQFFRGTGHLSSNGYQHSQQDTDNGQGSSSSDPAKYTSAWYAKQQRDDKSRLARQAHARKKE